VTRDEVTHVLYYAPFIAKTCVPLGDAQQSSGGKPFVVQRSPAQNLWCSFSFSTYDFAYLAQEACARSAHCVVP
jgi:hypothetical protein